VLSHAKMQVLERLKISN